MNARILTIEFIRPYASVAIGFAHPEELTSDHGPWERDPEQHWGAFGGPVVSVANFAGVHLRTTVPVFPDHQARVTELHAEAIPGSRHLRAIPTWCQAAKFGSAA